MRDRAIKEVMTIFPTTIEPEASLQTVLRMMQRYDVRHLPVLENQTVLGIAFERDVRTALNLKGVDADREPIRAFTERANLIVSETDSLSIVLKEMVKKKEDCALIMNGTKVVGIFTTIDAIKLLLE